jgi:hypothetical protein
MKEKGLELPEADFLPGLWCTGLSLQWTCPFVWGKKETKKVWNLPTRLIFSGLQQLKVAFLTSIPCQSRVHIFSDIFPNEDFILFYFK